MGLNFSEGDMVVFDEVDRDNSDHVILKTDLAGFIHSVSPAIGQSGFSLSAKLVGLHVRDLAEERFRASISAAFAEVRDTRSASDWVEFRSGSPGAAGGLLAIRFSALTDENGRVAGALCIVRKVAASSQLEERLFRAELTDPLTGLTNRQAWLQMLEYLTANEIPSCLALVDIDFFKAINLHYGLAAGDRFLVDFADLLRTLTPAGVSISRVGASRFGLLFSDWTVDQARLACGEIVEVLYGLGCSDRQGRFSITASIGLIAVGGDIDRTVSAAETALRLARAKGGNTVYPA